MQDRRIDQFTRVHIAALVAVVVAALALVIEFDLLRKQVQNYSERGAMRWRPFGFRPAEPPFTTGRRASQPRRFARSPDDRAARRLFDEFYVFLGGATLCSTVMVLRSPQHARSRPWRDWGQAVVAVSAFVGTLLACKDLLWIGLAWPPPYIPVSVFLDTSHRVAGIALGAWVAFALAGKARPRAHWRARLGRLIGYCWLSYFVYLVAWPALWWFMLRYSFGRG
jgi:hypothetical protein